MRPRWAPARWGRTSAVPIRPRPTAISPRTSRPTSSPPAFPAARRSASSRASTFPASGGPCSSSRPLNGLIQRSLAANPDIHAASASLRAAQFTARAQRATLLPDGAGGRLRARRTRCRTSCRRRRPAAISSTACSRSASPSATRSTCSAPTAEPPRSLEALAEAQCFQLEAAYLSLASNVVAAAIQEASLRAQIEATQRIIAAQRETLDILQRQQGLGAITGADVAQQEAALAQAEDHSAAAAEGAGPAAQPACHADRPPAQRPRSPSASSSPTSRCRRTCRSACRPGWSSSVPTFVRPRPTCTRRAPRWASPSPTSSRRSP